MGQRCVSKSNICVREMGLLFCIFSIDNVHVMNQDESQNQIDYNWVPLEGLCDQG